MLQTQLKGSMSVSSPALSADSVRATEGIIRHSTQPVKTLQPPSTVWRGFGWAFSGNIIYAGCHWGMFILLARLGSPEMVGQFALALAIAGPVLFVSNLQLRAIQASDAGWEHQFADYWGLRLIMAPVAFAVIAGVGLIGNYSREVTIVILVTGIESLSDLCFGAIQRNDRLDLVGKSLSIKGPATLLLMGLLIWLTQSVAIGIGGVTLAWLLLFGWFDFANVQRGLLLKAKEISLIPRWNWQHQKRLIAIGLPMGVSMGGVVKNPETEEFGSFWY